MNDSNNHADNLSENTDRELWRKPGATPGMEYYEPSIHVTQDNRIGIDVGGTVYVMPVEEWHVLAKEMVIGLVENEPLASKDVAKKPPTARTSVNREKIDE